MAMGLLENNRDQVMNAHFQLPDDVRKAEECPIIKVSTDEVIATAKELYSFVNEK
jgi:hypothetical protein